ncbi:MAG TPA: rhodanese-like domain-containing protein [Gemmatimonadaceae bacterium]|nr:rhodanese-like domain-containing protein [Gemmatimonadaceae bacterium]
MISAPVVRPAELAALLEEDAAVRLLDVRTPAEYETAHIHGAYNVPLDTLGEHGAELRVTVTEPVVLVCQSGQRARRAEEALKSAGMPNLHVLDGGMNGWIAAGKPVIRGSGQISLERQVRILAGALVASGALLGLLVSPWFVLVSALVGMGLMVAGITDRCGMAMVLSRLPHNQQTTCDVGSMVQALISGEPPRGLGRSSPAKGARAAGARSCA